MKRGRKRKSAYNKFAKTEEHASWAIRRRQKIKLETEERTKNDYNTS